MIKPVLRGYKLLNQVTVTKTKNTIRQKFRRYEMREKMAKALKQQYDTEEYIKQDESGRVEKAEAWRIAIGLQAVDGLRVSEHLLHTAREHIAGNITIDPTNIVSPKENHSDTETKVPQCIRINKKSPTLFPKFHCRILGKKVGLIT